MYVDEFFLHLGRNLMFISPQSSDQCSSVIGSKPGREDGVIRLGKPIV